ncbi:MAG: hypothetical protein CSA66_03940 [Proteobacteria bacterium]|nr:MAG: hypothetical protein CSA66_03940 [Pseudomonadota bacterium]
MSKEITRRDFFRITATTGAAAVAAGAVLATGCGGKGDSGGKGGGGGGESCDNVSGLSLADKQMRKTNKYVDKTPHADKDCANCQLYKAPKSGFCGGCTVLKGTINPHGYCNLWAAKTA